jgi:hypothetical protein
MNFLPTLLDKVRWVWFLIQTALEILIREFRETVDRPGSLRIQLFNQLRTGIRIQQGKKDSQKTKKVNVFYGLNADCSLRRVVDNMSQFLVRNGYFLNCKFVNFWSSMDLDPDQASPKSLDRDSMNMDLQHCWKRCFL